MLLYYGKTFESSRAGRSIVGVACDDCECTNYYELAWIGAEAPAFSVTMMSVVRENTCYSPAGVISSK